MYSAIARNKRNTIFIMAIFLVLIGALGWVAGAYFQDPNILYWTVGAAIAYVIFQYFLSGSEAVALSGAIEIQKSDNPRFYRIVENLAITTGMPMPKVHIINDPAPNAFAAGRDPKHAVVAATSGLLDIMEDDELEGVMAHEMGHVQNYDIRVSVIVFGLVVAVGFIADILLRMSFFARGNRENGNPVVLIVGLVAMIVAPLVATMVQLAVSRQREYLADATGSLTTRNPDALARALAKLGQYGRPLQKKPTSMAHMWISDPEKPGVVARLFATHPPLQSRIDRLRAIGGSF
jgi:heat shock protein HtpX